MEAENEQFFSLLSFFSEKILWAIRSGKGKVYEKLYKNTEDCRKFHSTPCLFQERWYTKTVFGCGFFRFRCANGYALNFFSGCVRREPA